MLVFKDCLINFFVGKLTFTGSASTFTPDLEIIYMDDFFGNVVASSVTVVNVYDSTIKIEFINNPSLTFTNNFSYTTNDLTTGDISTFVGGTTIKPNTGDSNKTLDLILNNVGSNGYEASSLNPLYIEIKVFPT